MKAAVCRDYKSPLFIEDVVLDNPLENEIEVTLKASAICHSDISSMDGVWHDKLPAIYGHEASGYVTKIGAKVDTFNLGDKVLVTLIRSCNACAACVDLDPTSCNFNWNDEYTPLSNTSGEKFVRGIKVGAFAEKVVVQESQCVKLPDDIPFDVASLLACGVITGFGSVKNSAKLSKGQTAMVFGCGGVGLNALQGAKFNLASKIIAVDISETKLRIAKMFGATHCILGNSNNLKDQVMELTDGDGVDYVFITVGVGKLFGDSVKYLKKGGTAVLVGMPPSQDSLIPYDVLDIAGNNISIIGSKMGQTAIHRDIPLIIDLWRKGNYRLNELISGRYSLENINDAIEETRRGDAKRNVIIFE